MTKEQGQTYDASELRRRAEALLQTRDTTFPGASAQESPEWLFHELQVCKIELELQNEELQRTREEAKNALFECMAQGVFYLRSDGVLIEVNPAALAILGVAREAFLGKTPGDPAWDVIDEQGATLPAERRPSTVALRTGQPVLDVVVGVRNAITHSYVWLSVNAMPQIRPGETMPYQVFVTLHDITRLRKAEEALRNSETLFRSYFELPIIGIAVSSPEKNWMAVNDCLCSMFGYSREELTNLTWVEITHPEDVGANIRLFERVLAGEIEGYSLDKRFIRKDGSTIYASIAARCVRNQEGAIRHFVTLVQDITERKEAEKRLQESEQLYCSLVENLPQYVFRKDREGRFTFVNQLMCRTLEKPLEALLGKTDFDIHPPEFAAQYIEDDRWVMETGQSLEKEEENRTLGATARFVHVVKTPLRGLNGNVTGIQGIFWDITERKQFEERLLHAQKMEAVGTLAGGIAHDFNNILQSILGYADFARDETPADSPVASCLNEIVAAGTRARELIARILAFSRKTEREYKPLRLQPVVKEALQLLRGTIPSTIEIRHEISPLCGPTLGDATAIHQIIMNLCTNAYHAMRDRYGVLDVRLDEVKIGEDPAGALTDLEPGGYARLTVADTGCGMDADVMSRIFDPYYTTQKHGDGSGLGLAVVHGLVKELKGAIQVESTVGSGSRFEILLPLCSEEAIAQVATGPSTNDDLAGTERVLVVDDEEQIVNMVRNFLGRLGYQVETCANGIEALDLFRADPKRFDVVVTDQTMPYLTGIQLAHEVLLLRPDLPVILCTGYSDLVDESKANELGIRAFIEKPFRPAALAETIRRVIAG